jgi:hypothetical protein
MESLGKKDVSKSQRIPSTALAINKVEHAENVSIKPEDTSVEIQPKVAIPRSGSIGKSDFIKLNISAAMERNLIVEVKGSLLVSELLQFVLKEFKFPQPTSPDQIYIRSKSNGRRLDLTRTLKEQVVMFDFLLLVEENLHDE